MASTDSCSSAPASLVWRATLAAAAAKQQQGSNGWDAPIICLPEPSVYRDRATLCRLAALLACDGEAAQVVDSDWRAASSWSPGHLPVPAGNTVQPSDVSDMAQGCITSPGLKQSAADPAALVTGALAAFEQAVSVLCLDVGGVAVVHDPESLLPVLWVRGDMPGAAASLPMPGRVRNSFSVALQVVNDCLLRDFQLSRRDVEAALVQTGLLPAALSCYSTLQTARGVKPQAPAVSSPDTLSTAAPVSAALDCARTTTTGSSTASHMAVVQRIPSNVRQAVKPGSFCPRAVVRRLVSQLLAWQAQPTGVVAAAAQSEAFYCTGRGFTMPVMTSVQLLATDLHGLPPLLTLATFHTGQAPRPLRHLPMPQHVLRAVHWGHRAQWRGVKRPRPVHPAPPSASPLQADATAGSGDEPLPILGATPQATDEGSLLRALYPRATCQALLSASISPFDAAGEAAATAEGLLPLPPPSHLHTLAHTARAVGEDDGGLALAAGRGGGDGGSSMRGGASAGAALKLQRLHAATARSGPALPPGVTLAATSQVEGTVVSVPGASVRVGGRRPVRPTPTHAGYAVGRSLSPAPFPAPLGPSAATVQV